MVLNMLFALFPVGLRNFLWSVLSQCGPGQIGAGPITSPSQCDNGPRVLVYMQPQDISRVSPVRLALLSMFFTFSVCTSFVCGCELPSQVGSEWPLPLYSPFPVFFPGRL